MDTNFYQNKIASAEKAIGMDFFKSGLKSVLGSPEPGVQPSGAETVNIDKINANIFTALFTFFD